MACFFVLHGLKLGLPEVVALLKRTLRGIREMPRPAYIMLLFSLRLSCLMLLASLLLFLRCFAPGGYERGLYMTAVLLLESPAGVLLLGGIGAAFFIDRS